MFKKLGQLKALPKRALTNIDLARYTKGLKHFRGIYNRDTLPKTPKMHELGIINLDDSDGIGTHWVAYKKHLKTVNYFDSYGNLQPPAEVISYFAGYQIHFNYDNFQGNNAYNCGHLCLKFLYNKL